MPSKKTRTPIEPGGTFHIYNRGNNFQDVFFVTDDYLLFLSKMKQYLSNYCSIYAFALLPNHYHLLIRVNDNLAMNTFSQQFLKFILSYTNKINFRDKRDGSIFLPNFKRIKIEDEDYLRRLIYYINHNPVKHKVSNDFKSYKFCSYHILVSEKPTSLARVEALSYFGGLQSFIEYHNYLNNEEAIKHFTFEDDI